MRAAAELIRGARLPVVAGLATDIGGVGAAIRLARACGGVVDHRASRDIYPLISAIRDSGMMLGAAPEVRRRADRILVVGPDAFAGAGDLPRRLFAEAPDLGEATRGSERKLLWLSPPADLPPLPNSVSLETVDCAPERLGEAVATIRAAVAGHRFGEGPLPSERVREAADWLKAAHFGCAIFDAGSFDTLEIEMLAGLVSDLNAGTRFTSLPRLAADAAYGAAMAATWSTGFPLRVGFGRGAPEHDAHLHDASRLLASGEADLVIDVGDAPEARDGGAPRFYVPTIRIAAEAATDAASAKVAFATGLAGRDHDSVLYDGYFGSFVPAPASDRSDLPSAAHILDEIAAAVGGTALGAAA